MQRYVTLRMRVASPASRSPLAFVPCRRISITRSIIGLFRKETRDAIKNTPGLQQALIQRKILEELEKGQFLGKYWGPIFFKQKRSREYVCALIMFERIAAQASRSEFRGSSLPNTFAIWVRLCFLHLWLVDVRFRSVADPWTKHRMQQKLMNYLWQDIESGIMETLGTKNPMIMSKYSKRLVTQWFGAALAFDYGMITSDAALAEAIWRNVYHSDPSVPIVELDALVLYVRQQQKVLQDTPEEEFLNADFAFSAPPFEIPDDEKIRMAQQPNMDVVRLKTPPKDPMADALAQQYEQLTRKKAEKEGKERSTKSEEI